MLCNDVLISPVSDCRAGMVNEALLSLEVCLHFYDKLHEDKTLSSAVSDRCAVLQTESTKSSCLKST